MDTVNFCYNKVDEADAILALGSSLAVLSGFRFVHHVSGENQPYKTFLIFQANMQGKPIFIVNIGPTRADHMATMKLDYKISDVLSRIWFFFLELSGVIHRFGEMKKRVLWRNRQLE